MNTTPRSKIGLLPKALQEQVNRRLEQGEIGGSLVAWLNSLPEVRQVLAAQFAGKPIREQNLSKWRQRGYAAWLRSQAAHALVKEIIAENGRLLPPGEPPLADQLADWISVRYLLVVRKLLENSTATEPDLKLLREFSRDLVALRRADHSAARLKMEQARLKRMQEKPNNPKPPTARPVQTKIS